MANPAFHTFCGQFLPLPLKVVSVTHFLGIFNMSILNLKISRKKSNQQDCESGCSSIRDSSLWYLYEDNRDLFSEQTEVIIPLSVTWKTSLGHGLKKPDMKKQALCNNRQGKTG